jgi:hypothetical protein
MMMNKFAIALAVIGSGAVLSACATQKPTAHAAEVPAPSGKQAAGSCGAAGGCGAAKENDGEASSEPASESAETTTKTVAAPVTAESEPATAGAEPTEEPALAVAPAATPTPASAPANYIALGSSPLDEPEFINDVLDRADCGLLLDLNNLDVNARNHRFDAWRWLEQIPLERVVEIHVAGPEPWRDGLLLDTHGAPVRSSVYELLDWVVERTGPVPVLLERDNKVPRLSELVAEVVSLDATYQAALGRWRLRSEATTHAA